MTTGQMPAAPSVRRRATDARQALRGRFGFGLANVRLAGVLLAISLVFFAIQSEFYSTASLQNIFISAVPILLLALGETFVIIFGGIDLSVAGMLALGGMVAGKVMSGLYGGTGNAWGITLLGMLAAVLVGTFGGMLNGYAIARLKVNALIVTLGTMGVFTGVASLISNGNPITNFPASAFTVGDATLGKIPYYVIITAVVTLIVGLMIKKLRFGLHVYAAGANREALRRSGVNITVVTVAVFGLGGLVAGLAGFLYTCHFVAASPIAGSSDLLLAVAAVVIGGTPLEGGEGTIIGTVIGALIISVLQNGFVIINLSSYWQEVAVGVMTVGAVYVGERERIVRILRPGETGE